MCRPFASSGIARRTIFASLILSVTVPLAACKYSDNDSVVAPATTSRMAATTTEPKPTTTTGPPVIEFKNPSEGEEVSGEIIADGTAKNLTTGQQIWMVLFFNSRFYPQNAALVRGNGTWSSATLYVGVPGDSGRNFDILAVLANSSAEKWFEDYLDKGEKTGSFPGVRSLPNGHKVLSTVTVKRQ